MKKDAVVLLLVVIVLLIVGWFLFQITHERSPSRPIDTSFRSWFWEMRGADLVVQVVLVFAGALGIAAILPVEDENE